MLKNLTVTAYNFKPKTTAVVQSFDTSKMSDVIANAQSGNIPACVGTTEFMLTEADGTMNWYLVSESLAEVLGTTTGFAGTVYSGSTVEEFDNNLRRTRITIPAYQQAIASANLAFGKKIYTFPQGWIKVLSCIIDVVISGATCTNTPDLGVGTLIGSGVQTVLSGVGGTAEDIRDGVATSAISAAGTAYQSAAAVEADASILDGHTTAKSVNLNMACAWSVTENLTISGSVEIVWMLLGDA